MKKYPLLASTLIAATALAVPAFAADPVTWTGKGNNTNWTNSDNWSSSFDWTIDQSNQGDRANAVFNGSSSTETTVTVDTAIYVGHLIITSGSYVFDYAEGGSISAKKNITSTDDMDVLYINGGSLTINGGTNSFSGALYMDIGDTANGSLTINGGNNTFDSSGGMYVGFSATGTVTITDGTNKFVALYIGVTGTGTVTISGGTNTFSGVVYLGGYSDSHTGTGSIAISGGTNTFTSDIDIGTGGTGTMTITGGKTTISAATTIHDGSSLSVGGGNNTATLIIETQIGTSPTGTVTISDNANIVISGALLESLEAIIDNETARVAIITANTIIFDTLELTSEFTGEDDLDSVINQYISAGDYLLTWTWDTNDNTLYASIAGTTSVPEPGMFSVFFGIGALGLIATGRRRRKA